MHLYRDHTAGARALADAIRGAAAAPAAPAAQAGADTAAHAASDPDSASAPLTAAAGRRFARR